MSTPEPGLTFVRELRDHFETRHQHARAARARTERRVARGVYMDAADWQRLDFDGRYRARVRAIAETRKNRPILSHWSAAVVHGLPVVDRWPNEVHTTLAGLGGRSRGGVVRHARRIDDADVVEVDGLLVTSIARTVLDIATTGTIMDAVAMADRALLVDRFGETSPLCTKTALLEQWERDLPFRGHARSRDVIEFAETQAESVIESISRVSMRIIGCPRPELQVPHYDRDGFIGAPDFTWREQRMLGEADGDRKYLDEAFRSGRTVEQVHLDEKIREDRLRALKNGMSRWGWRIARDPLKLRRHLSDAGLPMGIRW